MLEDLGFNVSENSKIGQAVLEVRIDASAARGIAARRGAGRIRHDANTVGSKSHKTAKSKTQNGAANPADLGTRHLDGSSIHQVLDECHGYIRVRNHGTRCCLFGRRI